MTPFWLKGDYLLVCLGVQSWGCNLKHTYVPGSKSNWPQWALGLWVDRHRITLLAQPTLRVNLLHAVLYLVPWWLEMPAVNEKRNPHCESSQRKACSRLVFYMAAQKLFWAQSHGGIHLLNFGAGGPQLMYIRRLWQLSSPCIQKRPRDSNPRGEIKWTWSSY